MLALSQSCAVQAVKILSVMGVTLFAWEHIARTRRSNLKPSVGFNWVVPKVRGFFYKIGSGLSYMSSFLTYIQLGELGQTAHDLFLPVVQIFGSPFEVLRGYWDTAEKYKYPIIIVLGSLVLVAGGWFGWYRYARHLRSLMAKI